MKKFLFVTRVHSVVDVITNSSSELFVGKNSSKQDLEALIKEVYPDYTNEYEPLQSIDELTVCDLDNYMQYLCLCSFWPAKKNDYPIPNGFTFDELYQADDGGIPAWNGEIQYSLKENDKYSYVTAENFEELKNKLDPQRQLFFLWSKDDNPNWDYQKKLENFMERFHLG